MPFNEKSMEEFSANYGFHKLTYKKQFNMLTPEGKETILAVRGPHAAVHCVAGSQQPPPVIRGVRIHRPAGVVKGVIRQKVVAGVVSPVVSVVPVLRLPLHPVVHLYQRSRLGCACV